MKKVVSFVICIISGEKEIKMPLGIAFIIARRDMINGLLWQTIRRRRGTRGVAFVELNKE